MAYSTPPSLVPGAPREELPYGLFSVLVPREGASVRFESGIQFEGIDLATPDSGNLIGSLACGDNGETTGEGLPKQSLDGRTINENEAFTAYSMNDCSPIGNSLSSAQELAVESLAISEEARVEYELWNGVVREEGGLFDLATALPDSVSLKKAVARLEATLAWEYGSLGILHASRYLASLLVYEGIAEAKGSRLVTKMGTPLVAGTGYDDEDVLIITPGMFLYRSEIFEATNRPGDLLDRKQNDLYGIAERTYSLGIDNPENIYKITVTEE